jgi:cytochrome P450
VVEVTLWNGRSAWLVTRYADARRALTDPCLSSDATDPNFPSLNPSQVVPNYRGSLARMDDTRHRPIRSSVAKQFTVRAAQQWRPVSERIVAEQLALLRHSGPPADLITGFALPVPLLLICRVLGVDEQDIPYVRGHAQQIITRAYESSQPSLRELRDFVGGLVQRNLRRPGENLIGRLVTEHVRTGAITGQDLADLSIVLLVAGHTTTASTIGLSVLALIEEPDRYRALCDEPGLAGPMVEEFLRFQTIVSDGAPRVAKRDLALGGVTVRAGDAVVISLTSANRDEQMFAEPDTIQLRRTNVHRHVAFGRGVHRCLGQHLARMELQVALAQLARTIPTLRLALPVEELHFSQREKHLDHLQELPVAW